MHHTKDKGDLGVLKAQLDLYKKGYMILNPLTEHAPFDLVAYKDYEFLTIQVKYRELKQECVTVKQVSAWNDRSGTHQKPIDFKAIDLYCIYCPETDECYYIKPDPNKVSIKLRVSSPKNNQKANITYAKDYTEVP